MGKLEDLPRLLELANQAFSLVSQQPFHKAKSEQYLITVLQNISGMYCPLVLIDRNICKGFLLGQLIESNFSQSYLALECHWYCDNNVLDRREPLQLLQAFEWWDQAKGAVEVLLSSGNNPRMVKILQRKGYEVQTQVLRKVLHG